MKFLATIVLVLLVAVSSLLGWAVLSASDEELLIYATMDEAAQKPLGSLYLKLHFSRLKLLSRCPDKRMNLIAPIIFVSAAHDYAENDQAKVERVILVLLDKGCDIDGYHYIGMTALHGAVLSNNIRLVKFLLANGANPNAQILKPRNSNEMNKQHTGMNALEYARYIQKTVQPKSLGDRTEIIQAIQSSTSET